MEKTLWVIGDSFAFGVGTVTPIFDIQGSKNYWDKEVTPKQVWHHYLGELLNIDKVVNKGRAGGCSLEFLDNLISILPKVKKEDIIISSNSWTRRYRMMFPTGGEVVTPTTIEALADWYENFDNYTPDKNKNTQLHPIWFEQGFTQEEVKAMADFFVAHSQHMHKSNENAHSQVQTLLNYIRSTIGTTVLEWSPCDLSFFPNDWHGRLPFLKEKFKSDIEQGKIREWELTLGIKPYSKNVFESLATWSEGMVLDGHWSPNGNKTFAHVVHNALNDNVHTLTMQDVAYYSMLMEDLPYIPYPQPILTRDEQIKLRDWEET